jgi:uncharacterized protein (TIGR02646 family)
VRDIAKGPEPQSLTEHRARAYSDYQNYPAKQELREALVGEQRGLCCYCLCRIRADEAKMKIEHWHSQSNYPAEQLVYSNLLGACKGGEKSKQTDEREIDRHCDTFKGDKDLSRNPANPAQRVEATIHYLPDGRIRSTDTLFNEELSSILNLNSRAMVNQRKSVINAFLSLLPKRESLTLEEWEEVVRDWNGESHAGELHEYCNVVVYWIQKYQLRSRVP